MVCRCSCCLCSSGPVGSLCCVLLSLSHVTLCELLSFCLVAVLLSVLVAVLVVLWVVLAVVVLLLMFVVLLVAELLAVHIENMVLCKTFRAQRTQC